MKKDELIYLSTNISDMCSLPLRIYKNEEMIYFHYVVNFVKDPFILLKDELLNKKDNIGYIVTQDFFYYSYIRYKEYSIIYGPFRLIKPDDSILNKMALDLDLSKDNIEDFISGIKTIKLMPLESTLQPLCLLYYVFYREKMWISDILINEEISKSFDKNVNKDIDKIDYSDDYFNNSYAIERELYRIVENGEIDELHSWLKNTPPIKSGILSQDSLRQTKNTFIAAITLISRSAIKGNMDPMEALSLSDLYIQKMELLNSSSDILNLQMNVVLDYTERVAKIRGKKSSSSLLINFNKYILSHISDAIKIEDICDSLYVSKSVLFEKIKKETGLTISNYILNFKINESKGLLKNTNKSISSISIYLGFSSQSHFNHTFKKFVGATPIEYRKSLK